MSPALAMVKMRQTSQKRSLTLIAAFAETRITLSSDE